MNCNVTVHFITGIQVVNVARCNDRLAQLVADLAYPSQGLLNLGATAYKTLFYQMHIEVNRLNLKHIIKAGYLDRFLMRFIQHCLKKFTLLAA
ncbi:hypothetical protein D3C78_1103090 [compost metagenome]